MSVNLWSAEVGESLLKFRMLISEIRFHREGDVGEVDGAARTQKFLRYGAMGCSGVGDPEVGKYLN